MTAVEQPRRCPVPPCRPRGDDGAHGCAGGALRARGGRRGADGARPRRRQWGRTSPCGGRRPAAATTERGLTSGASETRRISEETPSPPPSIPSTHVQSLVEGEASCRVGVFEGVPWAWAAGEAVVAMNGVIWMAFRPPAKRGGVPWAVKRAAAPSRSGESGGRHGGEADVVVV